MRFGKIEQLYNVKWPILNLIYINTLVITFMNLKIISMPIFTFSSSRTSSFPIAIQQQFLQGLTNQTKQNLNQANRKNFISSYNFLLWHMYLPILGIAVTVIVAYFYLYVLYNTTDKSPNQTYLNVTAGVASTTIKEN